MAIKKRRKDKKRQLPETLLKAWLRKDFVHEKGKPLIFKNLRIGKLFSRIFEGAFGPKGNYKLLVDKTGNVTIANDGAIIARELEIYHPVASVMAESAKTVNMEVGDGTKTAVILTGKLLEEAEKLLELGLHPQVIAKGYNYCLRKCLEILDKIAERFDPMNDRMIQQVALTALSKLPLNKDELTRLAEMVKNTALKCVEKRGNSYLFRVERVIVESVPSGTILDSEYFDGVILKRTTIEQVPKKVNNAVVAVLNFPLGIQKSRYETQIFMKDLTQVSSFINEEKRLVKSMVDKLRDLGVTAIFCRKGFSDLAKHYLRKNHILSVEWLSARELEKVAEATGAKIVSSIDSLRKEDLGTAKFIQETIVGGYRFIYIGNPENLPEASKTASLMIRGASKHITDLLKETINDALWAVKNYLQESRVLPGGGATEIEIARRLRRDLGLLSGKMQLTVSAYANVLEYIPRILSRNAGMDDLEILTKLRSMHANGAIRAGVDVLRKRTFEDMIAEGVVEPLSIKRQVLKTATEVANAILTVDDMIASTKREVIRVRESKK